MTGFATLLVVLAITSANRASTSLAATVGEVLDQPILGVRKAQ